MVYVVVNKSGHAVMTGSTYIAFGMLAGRDSVIEPHDRWPEERNNINLLALSLDRRKLPKSVSAMSVADFMRDYVGGGGPDG